MSPEVILMNAARRRVYWPVNGYDKVLPDRDEGFFQAKAVGLPAVGAYNLFPSIA